MCTTAKICWCLLKKTYILKNGWIWFFKNPIEIILNILLCSFNVPRFANLCSSLLAGSLLGWEKVWLNRSQSFYSFNKSFSGGSWSSWELLQVMDKTIFFFFCNLMKQYLKLNSCSFFSQILSDSEIPLINILTLHYYKKSPGISLPTSSFPSFEIFISF